VGRGVAASLFTDFEPKAPPKIKPVVADEPEEPKPLPIRRRLSVWTMPEIDAQIQSLEEEQTLPWDELIPGPLVSAAYFLPPEQLPALVGWFLERLRDLRGRVVEDSTRV